MKLGLIAQNMPKSPWAALNHWNHLVLCVASEFTACPHWFYKIQRVGHKCSGRATEIQNTLGDRNEHVLASVVRLLSKFCESSQHWNKQNFILVGGNDWVGTCWWRKLQGSTGKQVKKLCERSHCDWLIAAASGWGILDLKFIQNYWGKSWM